MPRVTSPATAPPRWPALDGLRGLAVLMVMGYHFWWGTHRLVVGGWVGVDLFFVLSGYLITSRLVAELQRDGRPSLRRFYRARWRRLGPALLVFLLCYWTIGFAVLRRLRSGSDPVGPTGRTALMDLAGTLTFSSNWLGLLGHPLSPGAGGLWSLSIEEQFYLLWPVFVWLAYRRGQLVVAVAVGLALTVADTGFLALAYHGSNEGVRVYFGTDTRAAELTAGALWAVLGTKRSAGGTSPPVARRLRATAGAAGLFALVQVAFTSPDTSRWRGDGLLLVAAGYSLVVLISVLPGDVGVARLLSDRRLRYVGQRSYALYLWHVPLALLARDGNGVTLVGCVAFAFVLAEASWRLVEAPDAAMYRWWARRRNYSVWSQDTALRYPMNMLSASRTAK